MLRCRRQSCGGHARDPDLKQRPAVTRQHLMRHGCAHGSGGGLRLGSRGVAVVFEGDGEGRNLGKNALRAVGGDHGAQHGMAVESRPARRR